MLLQLLKPGSCNAVWLLPLLVLGCGASGSIESLDSEQSAIINGEQSVSADDEVVEVLAHPAGSSAQVCTGTLVAPNVVITALHCVAQFSNGSFSCNADGSLTSVDPGAGALGELASPETVEVRVGVHPATAADAYGAKLFGTGSNQICRNDFAIIVLDRNLSQPLSTLRLARGVDLGEVMRIVGYGTTDTDAAMGRFARANLRVIDRGQDAGGSATGNAAPYTLVIGQGACHGDSGGPLFSQQTGALVGVDSLVSGASCTAVGVRNVYSRLEPFADLIQSAFDFAAQTPILEPVEGGADAGLAGEASTAGGGNATTGGEASGGRDSRPGGSGSRQDASCACRAAIARPRSALGVAALALMWVFVARRRRRPAQ